MPDLVWLLVAYKNMSEVDLYVDHLRRLPGSERFRYAICDNSPLPVPSRHAGAPEVEIVTRTDNPGYLEGALVALGAATDGDRLPDWIALSNTDLDIRSGDPLEVLSQWSRDVPVVVAPRITEGETMTEKNPHLLHRRSKRRHAVNAVATSTRASSLAYTGMHALRWKLSHRFRTSRHATTAWQDDHPDGMHFYSPYGALMFFSRGFFTAGGLPRDVPLLSEEYFIAEAALEHGAPVVYAPGIHAHHTPHSTTGPKVSVARADGMTRAFRAIHQHAGNRLDRPPDVP